MKIRSATLTTCEVIDGGDGISLDFIDQSGRPTSLQLPFDQAQTMAMTLPRLLTRAVQSLTGEASSRYVFPLGEWRVEKPEGRNGLIVTLSTPDGFEVSFGVAPEACRTLGWTLATGRDHDADASEGQMDFLTPITLN